MNAAHTPATAPERVHAWLLAAIAAMAVIVVLAYAALHVHHVTPALALAVLAAASAFDAIGGSMPLLLLLGAVAISAAAAAFDQRIPWLALAAAPLIYTAAKSRETAIGWGDVLAIIVLAIALSFNAAIAAIIVGSGASLLFTLLSRARSGRMTPFLALAGAVMLWIFVR